MRRRWKLGSWLGLVALVGLLGRPAGAAEGPDLLVIVMSTGPDTAQVALSYGRVVKHDALAAGGRALGRATGATVGKVTAKEERLLSDEKARGTSAEFTARGLVRSGAPLPVAALARSLPEWRRLQLVFLPGRQFVFAGPEQGTVAGRDFFVVRGNDSYQYDVGGTRREGAGGTESPEGAGREARGLPEGIRNILLGVSGLLFALGAWILWHSRRNSPAKSRG